MSGQHDEGAPAVGGRSNVYAYAYSMGHGIGADRCAGLGIHVHEHGPAICVRPRGDNMYIV